MSLPFVSVFSPNYNGGKYLPEAIESILNQTYNNFEYIIVDDCSTDNSWEIIQNYKSQDKRIRVFRNEKNMHVAFTRNYGFMEFDKKSKYFVILDSDDIALPNRIEEQVDFLENNPEYGIVGSNIIIIDSNSKIIGYRNYPISDIEIRNTILRMNPFAQSSIVIRKEVIAKIGFYSNIWSGCEDYDYWLRIGQYWKFANLHNRLIKYRLTTTQIKTTALKDTVKKTYLIQENAIKNYGYSDNLYNKIYRLFLKISSFYPKIAYIIYKTKIRRK